MTDSSWYEYELWRGLKSRKYDWLRLKKIWLVAVAWWQRLQGLLPVYVMQYTVVTVQPTASLQTCCSQITVAFWFYLCEHINFHMNNWYYVTAECFGKGMQILELKQNGSKNAGTEIE